MSDKESELTGRSAAKTAEADHAYSGVSALQALDAKWERRFESMFNLIKSISGRKRDDEVAADRDESSEISAEEQPCCSKDKDKNRPKRKPADKDTSPVPQKVAKSACPSSHNNSDSDEEICDDTVSVPDADTDLLKELDADLNDEEEVGEEVAISLANVVNRSFRRKFSETKFNDRFDKYLRPGNCDNFQVPLVNPEIWKSIPAEARSADIKMSHIQKAIAKAGTALASSTQTLLQAQRGARPETLTLLKSAVGKNGDALAAMGHAFHDVSLKRRHAIRPLLHHNLAGLCQDSRPVTQFLFGDNLSQSVKDIRETEKLGATVASPSTSKQYSTKPGANFAYTKSKSTFLAQRQWGQGQP